MIVDAGMLFGIIAMVVIAIVGFANVSSKENAANDDDDKSVLFLDKLAESSLLEEEKPHLVIIYRQSGNIQQKDKVYPTASAAIKAAASTFKRAKIPFVVINENSPNRLAFSRPWHNHRGAAEGKKVGSAVIVPLNAP
ncbi:hypothetical protein ACP26H_11780 [Cronobacter sakazakii]|uniref:hypothetical protein n=1 Tax=Cronobacter sakazakii TaxID=28141 RepID=UPI000BE8B7A9|nr:hypothetical protein [Cronobacter sakazakii]EJJ0546316.1 hypothetical protein [Cronobacter sakazakii]MDT3617176.1 hypothetical protein [Cronobacter sakazakii]NCH18387.1 hypothetical protein [Cronobacter sakazakii]PUV33610.1 hypothetical protein CDT96_10080 [Cronobacter sakazakii]